MASSQLVRQWRIIRTLEARRKGLSARELSDELGIHWRTVYRDIEALEEAGFPVYAESEKGSKRWILVDGYHFKVPPPFTQSELMSLWLYRDFVKPFEGTVFFESLESVFSKIKASLSPESHAFMDRVQSTMSVGLKPYKEFGRIREILQQVSGAAASGKRIEIAYIPLRIDKEVVRKVDPYQVWYHGGTIYLIGFCHLRDEVRTFVLDRMKMVRVTEEAFKRPSDFSLDDFLKHSFQVMQGQDLYEVKVRCCLSD